MEGQKRVLIPAEVREESKAKFIANNERKATITTEIQALEGMIKQLKDESYAIYNENGALRCKFSGLNVGDYYTVTATGYGRVFKFPVLCTSNDVFETSDEFNPIIGTGTVHSSSENCPWKSGESIDLYLDQVDTQPLEIHTKVVFRPRS